jgi:hypothetical protein
MLKNGQLNSQDILGEQYYSNASGDISIGTKIILRKIIIAGMTLTNVEASVVNDFDAPLLFGQSAMNKFGKFIFDPLNGQLTILKGNSGIPDSYSPNKTQFIITSKLNNKGMPIDMLGVIPFNKRHEYVMFVYQDDSSPFNVDRVYFEVSVYDKESEMYKFANLYKVETKRNWSFCYKGIMFYLPMKLKIKIFTDDGILATKFIDVVNIN